MTWIVKDTLLLSQPCPHRSVQADVAVASSTMPHLLICINTEVIEHQIQAAHRMNHFMTGLLRYTTTVPALSP